MWEWIGTLMVKAGFKALGESFLVPVLGYMKDTKNIDLEALKSKLNLEDHEVVALMAHANMLVQAQGADRQAMMNHKVWWIGWSLFVFPVGLYHAAIFLVSTMDTWINPRCFGKELTSACADLIVRRVPETQEAWAQLIVLSFFGLYAAAGIVDGVLSRLGRK